MKLELHPEAAKNFNQKAEELLPELTARSRTVHHRPAGPLDPDVHVAANFTHENIIGDVQVQHVDYFGNEVAKTFEHGGELIGLFDESYKKLVRIAEGMQKSKTLRNTVSVTLLSDLIFNWVTLTYKSVPTAPMVKYVLGEGEKQIQDIEVWMPIFMLHVQSDLMIGRVTLRTITRKMIDEWRAGYLAQATEDAVPAVEEFILKQQGRLQGFAAATIKLSAEPTRASEIAFEEAEQAVSLLRFFSPANFHPQIVSYCALLGRQHIDSYKYLTVKDGKIDTYMSGTLDGSEPAWPLSTNKLAEIRAKGLDTLSDLLNKDKRSEFQEELLAALQLYSRSSLAKDIADRLVYTLVALESLFLKNSSEPIMDNISERMAFLAGSTVDERRAIISNVKKAYALRSSFVHHGQRIGVDDLATLQEFMLMAWRCLQALIQFAGDDNATKAQFLNLLEDRKLS